MERLGDQLLAGAALPGDQHGDVGARHLVEDGLDLAHPVAHPEKEVVLLLRAGLDAQLVELHLGVGGIQHHLHLEEEFLPLERLLDVVAGAFLHRADDLVHLALARDHDDGDRERGGAHRLDEVHAGAVGKEDVEDDAGGALPFERLEPFLLAGGDHHAHLLPGEETPGEFGESGIVVYDKDIRFRHPSLLSTRTGEIAICVPTRGPYRQNHHKSILQNVISEKLISRMGRNENQGLNVVGKIMPNTADILPLIGLQQAGSEKWTCVP
ncbi:MAG: hypothetical protein HW377_2528, partial [Actinobacteria bacterium]|nr:hypothetical protein [Actinomycetota bacterium]